jgi:cytidyltransferase-like protein
MKKAVVTGGFDGLRSRHVRFLEEASRLGDVHVLLWPDEAVRAMEGQGPRFPLAERLYLLQAIRYVRQITVARGPFERDAIPQVDEIRPDVWAVDQAGDHAQKRAYGEAHGIEVRVFEDEDLEGFPAPRFELSGKPSSRKKVIVTGCYDWFHSGHVRFFEEVSGLGDLYVVVGHDENVRLLKGAGHPLFPQDERRYMVQAVRYVTQALISTGHGWMDAEPEIARLKPDMYVVNEDGDKPEKRQSCEKHGLQYVVLKRLPKEGLPRRESTVLRGF